MGGWVCSLDEELIQANRKRENANEEVRPYDEIAFCEMLFSSKHRSLVERLAGENFLGLFFAPHLLKESEFELFLFTL
jgi:hypothetical protein